MMKNYSWKTTAAALVGILTALGTLVLTPLLDTDPATLPQWGPFFSIASTALIGLFSRDDDKSSEAIGANTKP